MRLPLILRVISTLCFAATMAVAITWSKDGCPDKCGNVTIPYPFGIGSKCSANSNFTLNCENSTRPILSSIKMEALVISVNGIVRVKLPVSPMNCLNAQQTQYLATSLVGSPFTISPYYNSLVVLGCKNAVWLRANRTTTIGGCMALCDDNSTDTSCNGVNCCQTKIPPGIQELKYTYQNMQASNSSYCGYAFPVDNEQWFQDDYKKYKGLQNDLLNPFDQEFGFAPIVLDWEIDVPLSELSPNGTSREKISLISFGSGLWALILLLGAWRSAKAIRKRIKANRRRKFFKQNGGLLLEQQLSSTENGPAKTMLFSSKELAQATDHYNDNRILGRGGQGTVYKGMLTDGRIVAVKKSKKVDEGDLQVFINEVVILSQINHRNVVKLLGCCMETEVPLLVYEFIPNGSLFQHIHDPNEEFPLSWDMRIRIAREVAGALAYLHSAASAPIYHRDIKSTNILLDDKYRAKVSDFGTSRSVAIDQTHLTTRVVGTFGYFDPEYFQSSQFTEKSDVYSFGVVMVELLTGEKAVSSLRLEEGRSLATHFLHSMEEDRLFDILDARVLNEGRREEIVRIAQLARRCLHLNGKKRPTMKEVAIELEGIQMQKEGSIFLENDEDIREYHSIELPESSDGFSSTSEIINLDSTTAYTPDDERPFLDEP